MKDVSKIIVDEIYTYYHHLYLYDKLGRKLQRRNRSYLFTALIVLKNGKKLPFFKVYPTVSEKSLNDFLNHLPNAPQYFSDGAKMYQGCWIKNFIAQKSKETNIIESFNFYCRNFNPCLARKSLTYAKTLDYFNMRMIEVIFRWIDQFNLFKLFGFNTI